MNELGKGRKAKFMQSIRKENMASTPLYLNEIVFISDSWINFCEEIALADWKTGRHEI